MSDIAISTHDHDYSALLRAARDNFAANTEGAKALFRTDAADLFALYLDSMPSERQVHNCSACRRFIETYGGLVTIEDDGTARSAVWRGDVPGFYAPVYDALTARVEKARVSGVFYAKEAVWGTPQTGEWSHLHVQPARALVYRSAALTPGQAMAAVRENVRVVSTALGEFKPKLLDEGLRILKADAVARAERFVAPVQWLRDLHDRPKGRKGENLLWRAVALAPEGYCHPRAAVTGSLLEDIADGLPFEDIKRRFEAKMHPLQYQRPQAAPAAGAIKQAEELFERMGLAPALGRRFALASEAQAVWLPKAREAPKPAGGVFSHLTPKNGAEVQSVTLPAQTMTWDKFARTVLPGADELHLLVPGRGRFIALTTAEDPAAPPILKWDREDARNPLAWYVYPNGSPARQWGLSGGTFAKVTSVALLPPMMGEHPMPFISEGFVLVLEGCADTRDAGNALFPECLKPEVHGVRSVIEAYSRGAQLSGRDAGPLASGYDIRKGAADCHLRVVSNGASADYRIDRWD